MITEQLSKLDKTKLYNQFLAEQKAENDRAMAEILRTKIGREAYSRQFNMNPDQLDNMDQDGYDMLGVIDNFYNIDE